MTIIDRPLVEEIPLEEQPLRVIEFTPRQRLILKVMEKIEDAQYWDQTTWAGFGHASTISGAMEGLECGSACCVAGWTVRLATPEALRATNEFRRHGWHGSIPEAAIELLGASDETIDDLFGAERDYGEVMQELAVLFEAAGTP